ncbi:hypothetical protein [Amaricoccus macauensis]|uniref:hypothetical protein n=1 Tax=Amaricoccus macauensis TaxID=57001 RepID=UPI003C79D2C2
MKRIGLLALIGLLAAAPVASNAQEAPSQLERNVQHQLNRYGFDDVDATTLTTNQLAGIQMAVTNRQYSRSDKVRRVKSILANG